MCSVLAVHSNQSNVHVQNEVAGLLKPISEKIQEIQTFRERNRGSTMFNHLSAVSESIPALGWIAVVSNARMPQVDAYIVTAFSGTSRATFRPLCPQSGAQKEGSSKLHEPAFSHPVRA